MRIMTGSAYRFLSIKPLVLGRKLRCHLMTAKTYGRLALGQHSLRFTGVGTMAANALPLPNGCVNRATAQPLLDFQVTT